MNGLDIQFMYGMATACLILFCVLGVFDGIYFHLFKFRLHEHPESALEHGLHTARAFVFAPIGYLLYVENAGGYLLYVGLGLVALDLGLELVDVLVEQKSRAKLGGISSHEAAVHVFASSFKLASLAMMIAAKPASAFHPFSPLTLEAEYPVSLRLIGGAFVAASLLGGVFSVGLMFAPRINAFGALKA